MFDFLKFNTIDSISLDDVSFSPTKFRTIRHASRLDMIEEASKSLQIGIMKAVNKI